MWAVKGWLGGTLLYAEDPSKTENPAFYEKEGITEAGTQALEDVIAYAGKDEKTAMKKYVSGVNCYPETARMEMMEVKERFGKTHGRVGFHGYQSFAKGEVTPALAHEIGVKLAEELWGDDFQVVVATHLDKDSFIHTHFVVNSVAFTDGHHYHNRKDDYRRMREASDRLCREYGLSVIEIPKHGKTKQYGEWKAEKAGQPTLRSLVKEDVDLTIRTSMTDREFFAKLKTMGYKIKQGNDITLTPPGRERGVKLQRNFGDAYSIENIRKRILAQDEPERYLVRRQIKKRPSTPQPLSLPKHKLRGYLGLYPRYVFLLRRKRKQPTSKQNARTRYLLSDDIRKLDQIIEEMKLLRTYGIETAGQLFLYRENVLGKIDWRMERRDEFRRELRKQNAPERENEIRTKIAAITSELRVLRMEVKRCDGIAERSGVMRGNLKTIYQEPKEKVKERVYVQIR